MKLLLTIWMSAVLTQEVFSSTLVRYPRQAVSKPTSSVHTEYEATYEQKGKHGNGSYSTVSGKQEVVHDNCNDNWSAFADKCATLIKDLVASLGNAVSSKPGDATNLQLRIRNTFKHFDSTDNCTCFAKNSLTSLFDNITASTVQPGASNGPVANHQSNTGEIISSAQNPNGNNAQTQSKTCEGESCNEDSNNRQKASTANPKPVQRRVGQPNLALTNAKNVDPELADTSKELSSTNSRRGVEHPEIVMKDPSRLSGNPAADVSDSKQSPPTSRSSTEAKKILFPSPVTPQPAPAPAKVTGSPAEVVIPHSQSQSSTETLPLKSVLPSQTSTPQQGSSKPVSSVDRPAKNNGIVKSGTSVKPVPALSSASKISSPGALNNDDKAGSRSSQVPEVNSDPITPVEAPVKPVTNVVPVNGQRSPAANTAASDETPAIGLVVLTEPVNSAAVEPQIGSSKGSSAAKAGGSSQTPSVVTVAEPEITSKSAGDNDDHEEGKGSASEQIPIPTPLDSVPEPVNGDKAEPEIISSNSERSPTASNAESVQTSSVAAVAEPEITSSKSAGGNDDDCDEKKKSDPTPVVPPGDVEMSTAEPQITPSNSEGSAIVDNAEAIQTPTATVVDSVPEPVRDAAAEASSIKSEGGKDDDCDEEKIPTVTPVVSTAGSVSGDAVEPQIVSSKGSPAVTNAGSSQTPSVVSVPEPINGGEPEITSKSARDKDEEKGSESGQIPVVTPVDSIPEPEIASVKSEGGKDEDCDEEEKSNQTPVVPPEIPTAEPVNDGVAGSKITSIDTEGNNDDEVAAGNGSESNQRAVVKPVPSSFQDPSAVVSDGSTNFAPNPRSSVVPAMPVGNTGDSEMPVITQAADPTQAPLLNSDDSAPPETASTSDTVNVIPGLIVKQPQSQHLAQKNPSATVPMINSNSNLPDSTGPKDSAGTVNPSPIYQPLPTAPSATPSSDNAVINSNPQQSTSKQEVMPGVPLTSERDKTTQSGADQSISAMKGVHAAPAAVSQRSQEPANTAMPLTAGKGGKEPHGKVFIVTPVPVYSEKDDPVVVKSADRSTNPVVQTSKNLHPPRGSEQTAVPSTNPAEKTKASEPQGPSNAIVTIDENQKSQPQVAPKLVTPAPIYAVQVKSTSEMSQPESQSLQAGGGDPGLAVGTPQMLTTPIPVLPVIAKEQSSDAVGPSAPGKSSSQQHPLFPNLDNKKSAANQPKQITAEPAGPDPQLPKANSVGEAIAPIGVTSGPQPESLSPKVEKPAVPVVQTAEDGDLAKPTTFQTTSTDPTPPQKSIQSPPLKNSVSLTRPPSVPQDSYETGRILAATSPRAPHDDDDDEEEDCCSCESCTEEEVTNPQQYKEMACKDLEEARKELKAIFDKIKKRLKCGKKAPQKIVAS